jgi:hypothetical protein
MAAQKPRNIRKAALVGTIAVALTGTGAAVAWSASDPPDNGQSQSATPPGHSADKGQKNRPDKAHRSQPLHSETVVKNSDGSFRTEVSQRGTVESVSENSLTVKSEDGFSQAYAINAETRIAKLPALAEDGSAPTDESGKRLKPTDVTAADIKAGDTVRVQGVREGDSITAEKIVDGVAPDGPGNGMGFGRGHGHGHDQGKAEGKGKAPGKDQGQDDAP